ncbi:hypothetical protein [Janthinobacterium sp. B9-8]|uniref:hypothetical protein n=1 Tax=Janthinobacterium sp. B9-8 TaxID=1236179 RepID=UPI00061D1072|nr:hypothetical protein [Janthinobacterium sp. B9-8]AMC33876.1 hypothetical protein VN23_04300 [Janthinobacterium sp. B9-8]
MNLNRTKNLIHEGVNRDNPTESLIQVLESTIELISIPDNDFLWSSWSNEQEAKQEILNLISIIKNGALPDRVKIAVLFAPTGPLQEISLCSGWSEAFLKIADKYDEVEALLWRGC